MNVLVTGAAGFIGSHLAEALLVRGDTVTGLDNLDPYYDVAQKRANVSRLSGYPGFRMVTGDVCDREAMSTLVASGGFAAIAHLAALAGVRNAILQAARYVQVDLVGTQNLLDAAVAAKVPHFVLASTSSVYGDSTRIPFVETEPCDRPLQPYAAAKRAAEILGHAYAHIHGLSFTALRFFTVYGPYGRPDMMAFLVADSVTRGTQIPLYDGGEMYRDWTYVGDITDGFVAALDKPLGYEIMNLGRGEPTLVKSFVSEIEALAGRKANVLVQPRHAADVTQTFADIGKARRLLGFTPRVSVPEGVKHFWDWYAARGAGAP